MAAVVSCFESSQKGITECHNLIMHFRVSLNVLSLLEILHSHYDLSLRLPSFSFFQLNFFCAALSQQSFLLLFSFPISPSTPPPRSLHPLCLVFNTTPSFYSCAPFNTSAFSCAPVLSHFSSTSLTACGQVAEQLAYYIHVSGMVITEEMFDEAVQFGTVQGDPAQLRARWPECIPPRLPSANFRERALRTPQPT